MKVMSGFLPSLLLCTELPLLLSTGMQRDVECNFHIYEVIFPREQQKMDGCDLTSSWKRFCLFFRARSRFCLSSCSKCSSGGWKQPMRSCKLRLTDSMGKSMVGAFAFLLRASRPLNQQQTLLWVSDPQFQCSVFQLADDLTLTGSLTEGTVKGMCKASFLPAIMAILTLQLCNTISKHHRLQHPQSCLYNKPSWNNGEMVQIQSQLITLL